MTHLERVELKQKQIISKNMFTKSFQFRQRNSESSKHIFCISELFNRFLTTRKAPIIMFTQSFKVLMNKSCFKTFDIIWNIQGVSEKQIFLYLINWSIPFQMI